MKMLKFTTMHTCSIINLEFLVKQNLHKKIFVGTIMYQAKIKIRMRSIFKAAIDHEIFLQTNISVL